MQKTGTHKRILYAVYVYRPFCMCRQCQEPGSYLLCQSLFFCEMIFADFISFFINSGIAELSFWSDSGVSGCASTVCEFTLIGSTRGLLINVLLAEGFTTVIPRMDFLLRNSLSSSGVRSGAASTRLPSPKRSISKLLSFSSCSSSVSSSSASVIIVLRGWKYPYRRLQMHCRDQDRIHQQMRCQDQGHIFHLIQCRQIQNRSRHTPQASQKM